MTESDGEERILRMELIMATPEETKADIQALCVNIDGLLLELCEAGIYELSCEESPEGTVYNDVAYHAMVLDDACKRMVKKYPNTTPKEATLFDDRRNGQRGPD